VKCLIDQLKEEQCKYIEAAKELEQFKAQVGASASSSKRESEMENEISYLQKKLATVEKENIKLKSDLKALQDESTEMKLHIDALKKQSINLQLLHTEVEKILDIQAAQYHLCNLSASMAKVGEDHDIQQEMKYFLLKMETAIQELEQKASNKMQSLNINYPDDTATEENNSNINIGHQTNELPGKGLTQMAAQNFELLNNVVTASPVDTNDGWFSKVNY